MTNSAILERKIKESGLKRSFIANKMGISLYSLSLKINNTSEFKASEIETLCSILDLKVEERMIIFFASDVD